MSQIIQPEAAAPKRNVVPRLLFIDPAHKLPGQHLTRLRLKHRGGAFALNAAICEGFDQPCPGSPGKRSAMIAEELIERALWRVVIPTKPLSNARNVGRRALRPGKMIRRGSIKPA